MFCYWYNQPLGENLIFLFHGYCLPICCTAFQNYTFTFNYCFQSKKYWLMTTSWYSSFPLLLVAVCMICVFNVLLMSMVQSSMNYSRKHWQRALPPEWDFNNFGTCIHFSSYLLCIEFYVLYIWITLIAPFFPQFLSISWTQWTQVMPALKDKAHVFLLNEICNMWARYKVMAKCLGGFFLYLDRHFVEERKTASLNDLSICCFHDMVNKYPD